VWLYNGRVKLNRGKSRDSYPRYLWRYNIERGRYACNTFQMGIPKLRGVREMDLSWAEADDGCAEG